MDRNEFRPRADAVDGELFIETAQTAAATAALWMLLHTARQHPRPWLPMTVLCGEHGTGKTTLARRFSRAAQRSVACDLLTDGPASNVWTDLNFAWMVENFGLCPALCRPAVLTDEPIVAWALRESEGTHPTITRRMEPRPDKAINCMAAPEWFSPGNVAGHPTRRTSLVFVDGADRLLSVPASRRRETLDEMTGYPERFVQHAVAMVLIGSSALVEAVSEFGSTQVIRVNPMPLDEHFATVVGMIFGPRDSTEVGALHATTRGVMGALVHVARMQGLEPPFHVPSDDILSLPAPGRGGAG
jgi:hypothetical protein